MALCSKVPPIHIFAVLLGSLEIILFGGVIFGWHSLVYVYKDNGYFSTLCPAATLDLPTNATATTVPSLLDPSSPSSTIITTTPVNDSFSFTSTALFGTTGRVLNGTEDAVGYKTLVPTRRAGVQFQDLTCEEQMEVHSKDGMMVVCEPQDEQFNLIFSLSTGINGMLSFPSGYMYDRLGTRVSRIFSIVSFMAGQTCLIFASPFVSYLLYLGFTGLEYGGGGTLPSFSTILLPPSSLPANPYLLYPGFTAWCTGGYQILLTNLQLSCLIPPLRSTIMSLYSGSYDTSAFLFLLFKGAYEGGVSVNTSFTIQAVLYFVIFTSSTFLFLPKSRIPFPLNPGFRLRCFLCHKFCRHQTTLKAKTDATGEWTVDPTGSVILTSSISPAKDLSEAVGNSHGGGERDAPGNTELQDSSGGDGADRSLSPAGEKKPTDNDEADPQNRDDVMSWLPSETSVASPLDMERKISIPRGPVIPAGQNEKAQGLEGETERMLGGGVGGRTKQKTFLKVALSPLFLTDVMWISVQRLRSWIFVGMFNTWITRLACGDKAVVSHYTSVYAAMQFFGILTAPLSGRLMDRKIKGAEKYGNPRYERLHAAIASFVLNSTVSVLLTVCAMIPVLKLQYLTFVLHCLHRSFLYGPNSAFVANAFPNEHFGKLFGVTLTTSAIFSMLQYPLFLIMQGPLGGDPLAINVFLLVLMLISYIHPIYIWRYLQKKAKVAARPST
ncbi:LOW QUALITY PROTEIN: equilibrative nucleobase transporter 1-like [Babylonia areolata]|uniref:LOW QUALITY PROTEIN: equilibrative nucleobase transporter 1-like n=1 Tax=Babylonia areolata TaxID=304850 RepID=UPI003FD2F614